MSPTATIRSTIEERMEKEGYNFNRFGEASGINRGTLSAMLNGTPPKPISLRQLDLMTKALGHPEGWLYDLYIEECFFGGKPNWRRIQPYLIRCAELGMLDCIERVLERLVEDHNQLTMIFTLAEKFYEENKNEAAILFYECIVEHEKYYHSERLAISQYRLFRILIGRDMEVNLEAATRFEPFCKRLPEGMQLDGLVQLINVYFTLQKWDKVDKLADYLIELSTKIYRNQYEVSQLKKREHGMNTEYPLVSYYGYGYLSKAGVLENSGAFEEALKYINGYEDLSWFKGLDEEGWRQVRKFQMWAKANTLNINLMMGRSEKLPEYIQFLEENPVEILPSLLTIVISANRHSFSIENVLLKFNSELISYNDHFLTGLRNGYQEEINVVHLSKLYYQLAIYYFNNEVTLEGIDFLLNSLQISVSLNKKSDIVSSMTLFEEKRANATYKQIEKYEVIVKEVRTNEENGLHSCTGYQFR